MRRPVLIVDDEQSIRDVLSELLAVRGIETLTAENGQVALRIAKQKNVQVVFSDLKMEVVDGLEFCRQLREHNPIAIVYAMTGYPGLFQLSECRSAGFDDYLVKPVTSSLVMRLVEEAFERLDRWKDLIVTS